MGRCMTKEIEEKLTFQRLSDVSGRQSDVALSSRHVRRPSEYTVVTPRMALATLKADHRYLCQFA
jgi:hypothetical protein